MNKYNEGNDDWLRLKAYNDMGMEFECSECGEPADWRRRDHIVADFCNSCASALGAPDAYPTYTAKDLPNGGWAPSTGRGPMFGEVQA